MRSSPRIGRRRKQACNDFTDDSAVAEWFGLDVGLVEGSEAN